ncbi:hypothetical protein ElyMa_006698500 [Elysia marginata]|uniref:Uncharacterized protein n=1 Tax=Elysia marginata TaxID=1093978 RepID=A0AAV4IT74_9GAST|nr:hypothetical protein ElyMa_006698500 [Elysia marginata]
MHVTLTSPAVGLTAVYPCATPTGPSDVRWRRYRQGVKSAPAHARDRNQYPSRKSKSQLIRYPQPRPARPAATRLSLDDVVNMAEHTREVASLHSRRMVMEEAHRALRNEGGLDRSRPHSVVGPGLQSITSPMPSPSRAGQMDHIPSLLPLPSDRTFIPSPDQNHERHLTTPAEHFRLEDDCSHHPVARQCCEIMGPSLCRSCRRLESRAQNRKSAELECPRMRSAGGRGRQTFSLTQVVKRSYPRLSDAEIQDKLARGEIARMSFPWASRSGRYDDEDSIVMNNTNTPSSDRSSASEKEQDCYPEGDEEEDKDILHIDPGTYRAITPSSRPTSSIVNCGKEENTGDKRDPTDDKNLELSTTGYHQQLTKASLSTKNAFYFLAKLTLKLKGSTTTPLFFSDLKGMQGKILSGTVDRKAYMTLRPEAPGHKKNQQELPSRLKSAVSTTSTSSGKSGLSKFGSQLSREFMPSFVSPRKVKLIEEPKYKVYFEPPLLTKRRQIPNPSFFAGSNDEYSLPERLPDVIEFADSQRIAAMEKQIRSGSALSFVSSMSDEQQQQQQQTPIGHQEKLTPLPLGTENGCTAERERAAGVDSQPSSGRGSMGERGVSTPTPRSTMRVSSGGPLSARAVPEENEEDVQRELEGGEQNVTWGREDTDEAIINREGVEEEPLSNFDKQKKLNEVGENLNEPKSDVKDQGPLVGLLDKLGQEGYESRETSNLEPNIVEHEHGVAELSAGDASKGINDDKPNSQKAKNSEVGIENSCSTAAEVALAETSKTSSNSWSTFFLTNRELTSHAESREGPRQELRQINEEDAESREGPSQEIQQISEEDAESREGPSQELQQISEEEGCTLEEENQSKTSVDNCESEMTDNHTSPRHSDGNVDNNDDDCVEEIGEEDDK